MGITTSVITYILQVQYDFVKKLFYACHLQDDWNKKAEAATIYYIIAAILWPFNLLNIAIFLIHGMRFENLQKDDKK